MASRGPGSTSKRLFSFLVEVNPSAAARAMRLIQQGARNLLEQPEIRRPMGDESGRREFYLPFVASAYVLRYRIVGEVVVVIRVWHGREARA